MVDLFIGTTMQGAVGSANTVTAATVGTGAGEKSAYDKLVEMDLLLSENNTPEEGRFAFIPFWYEAMLRLDERFISFGTEKNRGNLRGTPVGEVSNLMLYRSNNVPRDVAEYSIIAGYPGATTYAEQISKTVAYEQEKRFDDAVKWLLVYGAKVTRTGNLVRFDATRGTLAA